MRRPAPLPVRDGLGPARVRLRGGSVIGELHDRFGERARTKVVAGEVVCADGSVVDETTELPAGAVVYLYRDLRDEVTVPFDIPVLYRDDDIVVVDFTDRTSWPPCRADNTSRRRRWCGCGVDSDSTS